MNKISFFRKFSIPLMELKYVTKLFLILPLIFILYLNTPAEIRFVSKTGSSTPPYLSWATAADSIQECINICQFGDTIFVANGVYKEQVVMMPGLSLIGAGMDSCVIDTRLLGYIAITIDDLCLVSGFMITPSTQGRGIFFYRFSSPAITGLIRNNKIINTKYGIQTQQASITIFNNIFENCEYGIAPVGGEPKIKNNSILNCTVGIHVDISMPLILNNIIVGVSGYTSAFDCISHIYNNLIMNGGDGIAAWDQEYIYNNVISGNPMYGISTQNGDSIFNNIIQNAYYGLDYTGTPPSPISIAKYNNFWNNVINYRNYAPDSTNIYKDPMFVNQDSLDFHLQMFSPLIDAGDPSILDKDGSRSDIGLFGGPYGESYTYRDLAPRPPSNLTAVYDSGFVLLRWNKNTEADFQNYRIYRDTIPDFMYDSTRLIGVTADSFYYDDLPEKYIAMNYYYKITAIDSTGHQSAPSEEVHLNITGASEGPPVVVEHYQLLHNYPNPFNSSTMIPYRLKEPGYVKLYIYDIKGEVVSLLVNEYQQAGYYEVRFNPTGKERKQGETGEGWWTGYNDDIATGIYLYQIMVRGEGNIPVFTDMGKMILLK